MIFIVNSVNQLWISAKVEWQAAALDKSKKMCYFLVQLERLGVDHDAF